MRITFVSGDYARKPRGGPRVVYEYANHLAARGHEVTVVHPRKVAARPPTFYRRVRRKLGEKRDLIFKPKMTWKRVHEKVKMSYVSDLSPKNVPQGDAVFATAWHTATWVLQYPPDKGEKFYLIQPDYELSAGPREAVYATWRAPFHKIVIAEWLLEEGKKIGCTDLTYVPDGIDHSIYKMLVPPEDRVPRVAFLYSADYWKGSEDAVKALALAKASHPGFEAVSFSPLRRPRSLPHWVSYFRNPSDEFLVEHVYNRSSIFLCASWNEGFGLAPTEAMACGCALVTTDCAGNRSYAVDGSTALVSEPKDPENLARNLVRLLDDDELRIRLATAGRRRINEFTWERSTDLLEELIVERLRERKE